MNPIIRTILAVLIGIFVGGLVNMILVNLSGSIIPPPEGVDVTTMEGLENSMHLFKPKHYIMPFLAHAIGTLVGALIAALISKEKKMMSAMIIGVFFLIGGTMMVIMLPSPWWFNILDLGLAYVPMAWLAVRILKKK